MGLTALCPGTFDPVTNGHLDIIERAAAHFDALVVAVLENPAKEPLFSFEERQAMLETACKPIGSNIEIASFSGLLVDFAKAREIGVIVKGLRAISDFDYELQMAQMNHRLAGVETFFMTTNPNWSYLSSSLVKEVAKFGGDASSLVPAEVATLLGDKLGERVAVDLATRIEQLDQLIQQAKSMPLSSSVLLNRDELLELVHQMRDSLPEEIKQARAVVKDREDLLTKAREKGDEILAGARTEQERMLSKEGVVQAAGLEADRIVATAHEEASAAQVEAENYVDAKLAQFEIVLKKVVENMERISGAMVRTSAQVEAGRDKLRETAGGHPAETLNGEIGDEDLVIVDEEVPSP